MGLAFGVCGLGYLPTKQPCDLFSEASAGSIPPVPSMHWKPSTNMGPGEAVGWPFGVCAVVGLEEGMVMTPYRLRKLKNRIERPGVFGLAPP